jgi:hypothetical protein
MVAVPRRIMKDRGASLSDDQVRITGALEFLVRGYWGPLRIPRIDDRNVGCLVGCRIA